MIKRHFPYNTRHFRVLPEAVDVDALQAENARLRAENEDLKFAFRVLVNRIEKDRNRLEMPPAVYVLLTDIVLKVDAFLKGKQS